MMRNPVLWAAAVLVQLPLSVVAQSPSDDEARELPPITVTADPFADRSPVEATQPTSVLTGEALERARGNTLGETLSDQPGVHSADFGAGSSRPVIRGLGGPRVRILDGGAGVADASTISPDHNVATEPFRARQIEVLKGPASLLYGSGAIGGVINVVSDLVPDLPSREIHGAIGLTGSSVDDGRAAYGHLGGGNGQFAFHLDGLLRETEDYEVPGFADRDGAIEPDAVRGRVSNSFTESDSLGLGVSWTAERGFLGVGYSTYDTLYGVPGHGHEGEEHAGEEPAPEDAHGADEGVRIDLSKQRLELRGGWQALIGPFERLRGSLVNSSYKHVEIEDGNEIASRFDNDLSEMRLELTHRPLGAWRGVLGVQGVQQEFSAAGEEAFVPPVDTDSIGLFVVEERMIGKHRLSLGLRGEQVEHRASGDNPNRRFNLFSASAGVHFELPSNQHLKLNLSHAQRAPDVQELYSDGPHLATSTFEVGNRALKRESALNVDLGWARHTGPVQLSVDLFYTRYDDFIFPTEVDLDGDGLPDRLEDEEHGHEEGVEGEEHHEEEEGLLLLNFAQADAEFWGAEAAVSLQLGAGQSLRLSGDSVRARLTDGTSLPRIPADRLGLAWQGQTAGWRYGAQLTRVFSQSRTATLEDQSPGYTLLGADIGHTWGTAYGDLSLVLRGRNLLDKEARNHVSFLRDLAPLPGRNWQLDLSYQF